MNAIPYSAGRLALPLLLLLGACGAELVHTPLPQEAVTVWAVDDAGELLTFDFDAPGTILTRIPITGLDPGDDVLAVDFPSSGRDWPSMRLLTTSGRLYRVHLPDAVATFLMGPIAPALDGTAFSLCCGGDDDVDVVSDTGQDLHVDWVTHLVDVLPAVAPPLLAFGGWYGLEPSADTLVEMPNGPTQPGIVIGPLGVDVRTPAALWWPLPTSLDRLGPGQAVGTLVPTGGSGSHLYTIDVATGQATDRGAIGANERIIGLDWRVPDSYFGSAAPRAQRDGTSTATRRPGPGRRDS